MNFSQSNALYTLKSTPWLKSNQMSNHLPINAQIRESHEGVWLMKRVAVYYWYILAISSQDEQRQSHAMGYMTWAGGSRQLADRSMNLSCSGESVACDLTKGSLC